MISIRDAVEKSLNKDLEAKNSLARGILNLSSYARSIQKSVENYSKKQVSIQSIVVTLSRLEKKNKAYNYLPNIPIKQLSVHTPIVQIVFPKNQNTLDSLFVAIKKIRENGDSFFSFSTSTQDIAIIVSQNLEQEIVSAFSEKPKVFKKNLSAVSIRFNEELVEESNVGLSILHKISLRNIVLDAGITTYNEFTLVFESKFLNSAIETLNDI